MAQMTQMQPTEAEQKEFEAIIADLLAHPKVQEMKKYIQHGTITTYDHCYSVALGCFLMNRRWNLRADETILVRAAFLHDFYLYDWHTPGENHNLHGFFHPEKSRKNAEKYFQIGKKEQQMIRTHMWPLTLTRIPTSKEAWILCTVDKYISTNETLFCRGWQKN